MNHPSPLEWMAFLDGELDEPRASEVALWLEEHPEDAALLARRQLFHEQVASVAVQRFSPDPSLDLTASIMAAVERENATRESAPAKSGPRLSSRAEATGGKVIPLPARPASAEAARRWPGALALVGIAAAAAAAAGAVWSSAPAPSTLASSDPATAQAPSAIVASVGVDDDAVIGDDGSAITSVEFGAQSGAIFYVRGQTNSSAVLWLDDNEAP